MKNQFKPLIYVAVAATLTSCVSKTLLLSGSYTDSAYDKGINVLSIDKNAKAIHLEKSFRNISNPSYFTFNKDEDYIYSVNENGVENDSASVFNWDSQKQSLKKIQQLSAEGSAPCHITSDRKGNYIVISNYLSGNIVLYKILSDNTLSKPIQNIKLKNYTSPAHAHMAYFTKDNSKLLVTDLGNDRIYQFNFNENLSNPILENPTEYQVPDGFGPRHLVFDRNEKYLYVLNELKAKIVVFGFEKGKLVQKQTVNSTDFQNNSENKGSASIKLSGDGKFLYTSNRGESNSISVFKIDNGMLKKQNEFSTGKHPREFIIDKSGKYLLVASRDSNSVEVFSIKNNFRKLSGITLSKPVFLHELKK